MLREVSRWDALRRRRRLAEIVAEGARRMLAAALEAEDAVRKSGCVRDAAVTFEGPGYLSRISRWSSAEARFVGWGWHRGFVAGGRGGYGRAAVLACVLEGGVENLLAAWLAEDAGKPRPSFVLLRHGA